MNPAQPHLANLKRKRADLNLDAADSAKEARTDPDDAQEEPVEEKEPEAQEERVDDDEVEQVNDEEKEEDGIDEEEKAEPTKICSTEGCGPHPLSNFHRTGTDLVRRCKGCISNITVALSKTRPQFFYIMAQNCKLSAKKRSGLASICTLVRDDLNAMWDAQKGCCAYTGVPMRHVPNSSFKASPERINNALGYVPGNVILIIAELNTPYQWTRAKLDVWLANQNPTLEQHAAQDAHVYALANPPPPPDHQARASIWRGPINGIPSIRCNGCNVTMSMAEFGGHGSRCARCIRDSQKKAALTLHGAMVNLVACARGSTKKRKEGKGGEPCTITVENIKTMFVAQRGRCHWTNIPMAFGLGKHISWHCSLERLNVARGYIPGNVALVCFEANPMDQTNRGKGSSGEEGSAGWTRDKINLVVQHLQQKRANEMNGANE